MPLDFFNREKQGVQNKTKRSRITLIFSRTLSRNCIIGEENYSEHLINMVFTFFQFIVYLDAMVNISLTV